MPNLGRNYALDEKSIIFVESLHHEISINVRCRGNEKFNVSRFGYQSVDPVLSIAIAIWDRLDLD